MVVLVIAAIAYAVLLSAPLGKASAADLKAAARTLASGLRQAQSTAMATRKDAVLTIDVESREYVTTLDTTPRKLPENLELKLYAAQSEVSSERRGSIRFYPDGSSTGGRLGLLEGRYPAGWTGPPPHVHREHEETFYVLSGAVRFISGAT